MNTKLSLGLQRGVSDLLLKDHRGAYRHRDETPWDVPPC